MSFRMPTNKRHPAGYPWTATSLGGGTLRQGYGRTQTGRAEDPQAVWADLRVEWRSRVVWACFVGWVDVEGLSTEIMPLAWSTRQMIADWQAAGVLS